jgi:outer membrane lipoprotein
VRDGNISSGEVHWGGQIVKVENLTDRTLVEVLALPLDGSGVPQTNGEPQGRFIVDKSGFLEPQEYAVGRLVEVRGRLNGFTDGKVGQADYRYPVVISERVTLVEGGGSSRGPRVYPSIGIGVGSGGSSWGGVGVGIGF